ncbi:hypothetical protein JTB14_024713 [Gonioctena quinquepunctata]|nr:hypothetical protein JTB14_024713 [Gonioctena quinquepunctata]
MRPVVILLVLRVATTNITELDVKRYSEKYGYIGNNTQTDFIPALSFHQERYNLPVDGTLNNDTIELLNRPRCQHPENEYRVASKWSATELQWYSP